MAQGAVRRQQVYALAQSAVRRQQVHASARRGKKSMLTSAMFQSLDHKCNSSKPFQKEQNVDTEYLEYENSWAGPSDSRKIPVCILVNILSLSVANSWVSILDFVRFSVRQQT